MSVAYQRVKKGFVLLPPIHCTAFVRWGVIPYVIIVIKSIHPVFFYFFSCHSFSVSGQLSSSQPAIQPAVNVSSVCVAQDDARRRRRKAGGCCRWRTSTQRPDMNAKCNGTPFSRFIHPCVYSTDRHDDMSLANYNFFAPSHSISCVTPTTTDE